MNFHVFDLAYADEIFALGYSYMKMQLTAIR